MARDASGAQVTSRDGAIRTLRDPDCGVISRNSLVIAGESSVHTAVCPTHPTHQLGHCQLSHRGAVGLSESGRWILLWGKLTLGSAGGMGVGPGTHQRSNVASPEATVAMPMALAGGNWPIQRRQMQRYPTPKSPAVVGTRSRYRRVGSGRCSP